MLRRFSKNIIFFSLLGVIFFGAFLVTHSLHAQIHAQSDVTANQGTSPVTGDQGTSQVTANGGLFPNPAKGNGSICTFLIMLLNLITEVGAIIGVLALICVGFYFVWAQGKEEKLKTAKYAFLWTVLGVVLLLGASVIGHILITTVNAVLTAGGNNLPNQSDLTCSP